MSAHEPTETNWGGNVTYSAARVHLPTTIEDLQSLVAGSRSIRALGTRHSFSRVADGSVLVSLGALTGSVEVDPRSMTARVAAGMRWGDVAAILHEQGFGLPNLGSLPHIGVAGSIATATHGSGDANGVLATGVRAIELVTATGELTRVDARSEHVNGSVVALGCLGVVTHVTVDLVPTYDVRQDVYDSLPWTEALDHLDEIMGEADSVSLFTTWRPDAVDHAWLKRRVPAGAPGVEAPRLWRGATAATTSRHPIPGLPGASCTEQLGRPGPWHLRLPHFRLDQTPSSGQEIQTEYFVDRSVGAEAVGVVRALAAVIAPVLLVSEIRTVAADELWLSPAYRRDSLALHFTWVQDQPAVSSVLTVLEAALAPYNPRPHWGKLFGMPPEQVAACYDRFEDMRALVRDCDPDRVFRNAFVDDYLPH